MTQDTGAPGTVIKYAFGGQQGDRGTVRPLANVRINTLFFGEPWQRDGDLNRMVTELTDFFAFIVEQGVLSVLDEYSVDREQISPGRIGSGPTFMASPVVKDFTDDEIRASLIRAAEGGQGVEATREALHMVFVARGITVWREGAQSCQQFCAYHSVVATNSGPIFYAVVAFPDCPSCSQGLEPRDALTAITSGELFNAITDPVPRRGWFDPAHAEIADVCTPETKRVGPYLVRTVWSNSRGMCV